ncbi:MAG: c-type cytochrome [Arcobacteraceae bacterium]|nr:c-type cytochrome [Arcobacteraceae bacterium]
MKNIISIGLLVGLVSTIALADGATAYKKCVACHGANGEKVALGKSKIIKDMTKAEVESSLLGYQNGTYGGAMKGLMAGQVKTLSASDIKDIANLIGK